MIIQQKTKNFQLVFPIDFEINIPADDSVRLLSNVLEKIDYTELYEAYSRKKKNNAVSPKNLFFDGTKIEANVNKYTFVRKKAILKNQAKLQDKMHNARCNTPLEERTKRFELSKVFKKQREQMLERINTEQGIRLRINRSIQVEGAFRVPI